MSLSENKKAGFDYEILEKFQAGIELTGHETKSAKTGRLNLTGSHAIVRDNEIFLVGANIQSFQPGNAPESYDPQRTRKLLLKREEIKYLLGKTKAGLTLVPLRAYTNRGLIKLEIG
ncbi:MAG: SsrA-binding protein, partial [Patescibacteria group bacterium]